MTSTAPRPASGKTRTGRFLPILLIVLAVLAAGGWWTFQVYKIYLPGFLARLQNPIQPNQPIAWAQGPAEPGALSPAARPPNVVLIMADDLGINDITLNGGGVAGGAVPTPNVDRIGREGVNFANGYSAHATCSPSRAALMTGRYPSALGFEMTAVPAAFARNIVERSQVLGGAEREVRPIFREDRVDQVPPGDLQGLPPAEVTLAELLRDRGYHTVHIGKWHLGEAPSLRAEAQGFAESVAINGGASLFLPDDHPDVVNAKQPFDPIDQFLWANLPYAVRVNGGPPMRPVGLTTDYFADEAVKVIEANRNRPFFLYLAFTAPHTPLQSLRSDYDALSSISNERLRVYGGMIRALDRGVGKVLEALAAQGLADNTIVIFTSDNGGAHYVGLPGLNDPYRGWKATFFEGGIHVPFLMRWPARIAPGTVAPGRAGHWDVFATCAAAAGAPIPSNVDGIDLVAAINGSGPARERAFWHAGGYRTVIDNGWKLQLLESPRRAWLFDLTTDPTERTNLAETRPDKLAELTALLEAQEVRRRTPPLWPGLVEAPIYIDRDLEQVIARPPGPDEEYIMWPN